jgi:hypothetical protein
VLIDKTHIRWCILSSVLFVIATASYVVYVRQSSGTTGGGTFMGMIYGISGSLMMLFAGLLAARKRVPTWRIGSAQFWLRGHLWLGTLSVVLILFHSGFTFGGPLETVLMISLIVVATTGFYGLVLQHILPRMLMSRVPMETFNGQVPYLCQRLQAQSDLLVAEICGKMDCDYEQISDAAYNLADSLGKLRNGKEGVDFQKFLAATYSIVRSQDVPTTSTPRGQQKPRRADPIPVDTGASTGTAQSPAEIDSGREKTLTKPQAARLPAADISQHDLKESQQPTDKRRVAESAATNSGAQVPPDSNVPDSNRAITRGGSSVRDDERKSSSTGPQMESPTAQSAATASRDKTPGRGNEIITISCPKCTRELKLPNASLLGQFGRCPRCQHKFVLQIPGTEPAQAHAEVSPASAERFHRGDSAPGVSTGSTDRLTSSQSAAATVGDAALPSGKRNLNPKVAQVSGNARSEPNTGSKTGRSTSKPPRHPKAKADDSPDSVVTPVRKDTLPTAGRSHAKLGKRGTSIEPIARTADLKRFYLLRVRPFLASRRQRVLIGTLFELKQFFRQMRNDLPVELHRILDELLAFSEERHQYAVQQRIHWWLHSWLIIHIPVSIGLVVLLVAHVVVSLRVVPWSL